MAEQARAQTPIQGTSTVVVESEEEQTQQDVRSVRLKLRKPKSRKSVQWESGTVDNEHMNKKKSKCCCQYVKPREFDESSSSSSSDEDCEHCAGHVEKKKHKKPSGEATMSADATETILLPAESKPESPSPPNDPDSPKSPENPEIPTSN